jgi:hypothetical protein
MLHLEVLQFLEMRSGEFCSRAFELFAVLELEGLQFVDVNSGELRLSLLYFESVSGDEVLEAVVVLGSSGGERLDVRRLESVESGRMLVDEGLDNCFVLVSELGERRLVSG